ncbi:adenylate/guanylate cyclase domain-containing protein [Cellulosimicrobium sp. KWT-B]|uniref:adenylate/guanylate cyclase domain-containing protein n=1 Tax=Cellulosimicrobium sp. KWT-B TaxID=1981152 RepID=UPI000A31F835|nr:adenylate/guanylate cyclase domain-containing protein [Cellulosimicrobium sp. KWT-B]
MFPTIETSVSQIFSTSWNITDGTVVPKTEDVVLRNGGRRLDAVYLYADLAGSSKLAQSLLPEATAKIVKAYVNTATRILRHKGGHIRSFDGDRVMAIFMGNDKEDRAVRAALAINWAVIEVIRPAIRDGFSDGADFCNIQHGIGIDSGEALVIRGGIRDNNDLISIGASPNVAAKLSDIRAPGHSIFITDNVKEQLSEEHLKFDNLQQIWSRLSYLHDVGGKKYTVWGTSAYWGI